MVAVAWWGGRYDMNLKQLAEQHGGVLPLHLCLRSSPPLTSPTCSRTRALSGMRKPRQGTRGGEGTGGEGEGYRA